MSRPTERLRAEEAPSMESLGCVSACPTKPWLAASPSGLTKAVMPLVVPVGMLPIGWGWKTTLQNATSASHSTSEDKAKMST